MAVALWSEVADWFAVALWSEVDGLVDDCGVVLWVVASDCGIALLDDVLLEDALGSVAVGVLLAGGFDGLVCAVVWSVTGGVVAAGV